MVKRYHLVTNPDIKVKNDKKSKSAKFDHKNPAHLRSFIRPRAVLIALVLLIAGWLYIGHITEQKDKIGEATIEVCKDYAKKFGTQSWYSDWYNKECKRFSLTIGRCGDGTVNADIGEECEGNSQIQCSSLNAGYDFGTAYCVQCSYDTSTCAMEKSCDSIKNKIDSYTKELAILNSEYASCTASLKQGYRNAYVVCRDGWELYEGDDGACKSDMEWQSFAVGFCRDHCNAKTGLCGLQKVDMWNDCSTAK